MTDKNNEKINPLNIIQWRAEAETIAIEKEFTLDEEKDAFIHTYTNAMVTWKYGIVAGYIYADMLGGAYEILGLGITAFKNAANFFGADFTTNEVGYEFRASKMDMYNNKAGVEIGSSATSKEDLIAKVSQAIRDGRVVTDPNKMSFGSVEAASSLVDGEYGANRATSFNPAQLTRILGSKRSANTNQILLTSAAALARELARSRRRKMEESMIDIIRGNTSSPMDEGFGTPPIISGNSRASGSAVYNALENIVGSMLSRQHTRTTTYESERSLAAQKGWNLSQGQSAAMLAQAVKRGMRNL